MEQENPRDGNRSHSHPSVKSISSHSFCSRAEHGHKEHAPQDRSHALLLGKGS